MTLSKAKLLGIPLLRHSCLLLQSPTTALGSSCCTCSKCPHSLQQASSLTPDPLKAEPPPDLPSEDGQLPLVTPPQYHFRQDIIKSQNCDLGKEI